MASFKLNVARIQGCPPPEALVEAMETYGLPEDEDFGVLNCHASGPGAFARIVRRTTQAVPKLDAEAQELTAAPVEKAVIYPIGVHPSNEILEAYEGPASAVDQLGQFFGANLALPTVVEAIEIDVLGAVQKLMAMDTVAKFQIKSCRISDYAHNSFMMGPYAPKFLDSANGLEFMEQYAEALSSAQVRFQGPTGRVNVTISTTASFRYSCQEDDQSVVQSILRKLI